MTSEPHTSAQAAGKPEAAGANPEIIFFGRLEERKGLIEFVEALIALAGKGMTGFSVTFLGKEIRLYSSLGGRVSSGEYIRRKLDGQGFPYQILSDLSSQGAIAYVRRSRSAIVCLASPTDNFPNTGLEMAQVPVPLVLSDTLAFRQTQELVGRKEGVFWFKPESVESLCTQLGKALEGLPAKIAVPEMAAIQAINKGLVAQRLRLIEETFASALPYWPQVNTSVRVCILSNGKAGPIKASMRSLQCMTADLSEILVWSPEELTPEVAADVKSVSPGASFAQEIASPPEGPDFLLLLCAGATLQPACLENFVEAATRSQAGLVVSAGWGGLLEKEVRSFNPGSASQLLQANRSSGGCIFLSRTFYESLPAPTADTPHLMIWQLTLAAAITGEKTAYLPYPQYCMPPAAEPDCAEARSEKNLALLSRYATSIPPGQWVRREIFGMALTIQQLAESLHRTRESLAQAEQQGAQTKQELASVHASGAWRLVAWLRKPRREFQAFMARRKAATP
jgi:hypothetical protein